jgi:hypothetical protein
MFLTLVLHIAELLGNIGLHFDCPLITLCYPCVLTLCVGWVQERSEQVFCSGWRFDGDVLDSYFNLGGYWICGFVVQTVVVCHPLTGVSVPGQTSKPSGHGS